MIISSINHYAPASVSASADVFTSIYKLLNEYGSNAGIYRIAYNVGSRPEVPVKIGFNYTQHDNKPGNNAWACFQFTNANNPFYLLIQVATGSVTEQYPFGTMIDHASGTLMSNCSYVSYGGVGMQIATSPRYLDRNVDYWIGSHENDGNDVKSYPCTWLTGTGDLVVFPRSNNTKFEYDEGTGGISHHSKSNYTCVVSQNELNNSSLLWHVLADENTFAFVKTYEYNPSSPSHSYSSLLYGEYSENTGFASKLQYYMTNHLSSSVSDPSNLLLSKGYVYGHRMGSSSLDGGIAYPTCRSGSFNVGLDLPVFISESKFQPCSIFSANTDAPIYDEFPWAIAAYDLEARKFGYAGSSKFVRALWGNDTHTVFRTKVSDDLGGQYDARAVFGNSQTNSVKMTFPWPDGAYNLPGTHITLSGTQVLFSNTY